VGWVRHGGEENGDEEKVVETNHAVISGEWLRTASLTSAEFVYPVNPQVLTSHGLFYARPEGRAEPSKGPSKVL
jgi:hypothetical protein